MENIMIFNYAGFQNEFLEYLEDDLTLEQAMERHLKRFNFHSEYNAINEKQPYIHEMLHLVFGLAMMGCTQPDSEAQKLLDAYRSYDFYQGHMPMEMIITGYQFHLFNRLLSEDGFDFDFSDDDAYLNLSNAEYDPDHPIAKAYDLGLMAARYLSYKTGQPVVDIMGEYAFSVKHLMNAAFEHTFIYTAGKTARYKQDEFSQLWIEADQVRAGTDLNATRCLKDMPDAAAIFDFKYTCKSPLSDEQRPFTELISSRAKPILEMFAQRYQEWKERNPNICITHADILNEDNIDPFNEYYSEILGNIKMRDVFKIMYGQTYEAGLVRPAERVAGGRTALDHDLPMPSHA